jgi:hypothetical protein
VRRLILAAAITALATSAAAGPRDKEIKDRETLAWWRIAEALSSDAMEGRDTGSGGYNRAADLVAARFKAAGLRPAGDAGRWFQVFPVHEAKLEKDAASFTLLRVNGQEVPLAFLHQVTVRAADGLPGLLQAPLAFRGYCGPEAMTGVEKKIVICFGTRRTGLPSAAQRLKAARDAGALAVVNVDDPYFTLEPYRWPYASARTVSLAEGPPPTPGPVNLSASPEAFAAMIEGSGQDAAALLKAGGAKQPAPSFDVPAKLRATFKVTIRDYTAKNVLGVLPGRDPVRAAQALVISAHLDGYGYGEPVDGDALYNGALDDAAYVGTVIRFADRRHGRPLARSVVFAAFAGEEKGLLGSTWFARHPTVPPASLVGAVNLDQLRPLFPLKLMTTLAVNDSTLGDDVRAVAGSMGIAVQPDPEPERGLLQRADHWPFILLGVPATGFIFGYKPGTEAERRYREWYQVRYHRPQDDLTQPMDFAAAKTFNDFFYRLIERLGDADRPPAWKPDSPYGAKP